MALIAASGCANADGGGGDDAALAQLVGTSLVTPDGGGDIGALADSAQLVRGVMPAGFRAEGDLVTGEHMGVHYTYLVQCFTTRGVYVPCGPSSQGTASPARAVVLGTWNGTVDAVKLRRAVTWWFDGLETGAAHLTGDSGLLEDATLDGVAYHLDGDADHDALVRMATADIMSGTETLALTGTRDGVAFSTTADVTLGGNVAHVSFDGGEPYDIDLTTGPLIR